MLSNKICEKNNKVVKDRKKNYRSQGEREKKFEERGAEKTDFWNLNIYH